MDIRNETVKAISVPSGLDERVPKKNRPGNRGADNDVSREKTSRHCLASDYNQLWRQKK